MSTVATPSVTFRPRRLGHANLFVGDVEEAIKFYNLVCGLELVRREVEISAGFLTNGNTHHDMGLMQAQVEPGTFVDDQGRERTRFGRDRKVGLNHLGWEVDNEAQLVEAWRAAKQAGAKITRTLDHQISRSVYVHDPDGNEHEFYADTLDDWRSVFNLDHDDIVTKVWNPEETVSNPTPLWIKNPDFHKVDDAHFHADFITHVGLVARDYEAMKSFFIKVAGLEIADEDSGKTQCLLRGPVASLDLILFAPREGVASGVSFIAFVASSEEELLSAQERAERAGVKVEFVIDRPGRRSVTLRDPDGRRVVIYTRSSDDLGMEAGREIMQSLQSLR